MKMGMITKTGYEEVYKYIDENLSSLIDEYLEDKKKDDLWLHDFLVDTHYDEYMRWVEENLTDEEIDREVYIEAIWLNTFVEEERVVIENWLSKDDKFLEWAEKTVADIFESRESSKTINKGAYMTNFNIKTAFNKQAGTELWKTPEGTFWLLSTVTMKRVGPYFDSIDDAVYYAVERGRWTETAGQKILQEGKVDGEGSSEDFEKFGETKKAFFPGKEELTYFEDLAKDQHSIYMDSVEYGVLFPHEVDKIEARRNLRELMNVYGYKFTRWGQPELSRDGGILTEIFIPIEKENDDIKGTLLSISYKIDTKNDKKFLTIDITSETKTEEEVEEYKEPLKRPLKQSFSGRDIAALKPEYFSIGIEDIREEAPSYHQKKQLGRFSLNEIVMTPYGKGRVIRKQTDYKPYAYTVIISGADEPEIVEESEIEALPKVEEAISEMIDEVEILKKEELEEEFLIERESRKMLSRKGELRVSKDTWVQLWIADFDLRYDKEIEEIKKKDISLNEKIQLGKERAKQIGLSKLAEAERHLQDNGYGIEIEIDGLDIDQDTIDWSSIFEGDEDEEVSSEKKGKKEDEESWITNLWLEESEKIIDEVSEESEELREELRNDEEGALVALLAYYTKTRLHKIEEPFTENLIEREEVDDMIVDLLEQFRLELYSSYNVPLPEKEEKEERKESFTDEELPNYGTSNIYPYKGTGGGVPSSSYITNISDEIITREVK